ncbi:MAG: 30S ribosomal protein S8 [Patescibacteria group bacterium]
MDNIANMLTIIRNAQAVKKETASVLYTKINSAILSILEKEGFIKKTETKGKKNKKIIEVSILYDNEGLPRIQSLRRVSTSSRRIYLPIKKINPVQYGQGTQIVSTSKGLMTDKEARKQKVGGEILCEIW